MNFCMSKNRAMMLILGCSLAACSKESASSNQAAVVNGSAVGSGSSAPVKKELPPAKAPVAAAARGAEHAVFSLLDNRLAAHRFCGNSLVVEAGSMGFVKYTRFGNTVRGAKKSWELGQSQGGVAVAKLTGKTASMYVPLTAKQIGNPLLTIRTFSEQAQSITVKVNGGKDQNKELAAGWVTTEVKAENLKEGENELILFMGKPGAAVAWVVVGGDPFNGENADSDAALAPSFDGKALSINNGCGMSWYTMVPDKSQLTADLVDGACSLHATATSEDGKVVDGTLAGTGAAVDLSELGGKAARIDVVASGCPETKISKATLVVAGEAAKPAARAAAPKYVVLWVMDSLRADRVRPFNPKARPETPTFEKLAADSALFMQTYVQGNESRVSHASIWTSLYPIKHRSIEEKEILDLKWFSVEEVAKKANMKTFGVSANGYIRPKRGFGDKWDQYVNHIEKSLGLKGADIVKQGLAWVETNKEPWFLYLGTIDTHVTWRPKSPWIEKYAPGYSGRFAKEYGDDGASAASKGDMTDAEKNYVRALYDSNVSYQDDLLAQFIEKLKAAGVWEQTMLIVTADHGDEQWEAGKVGHGGSVRDMLVHVPLVVHYPPMIKPGLVAEGAESVDIVPTIADALGVEFNKDWQGRSLIPVANGDGIGAGYPMLSVSSQYENYHAGRLAHWKMTLGGPGAPKLYNLATDKNEMTDIYGDRKSQIGTRMMLDVMWQYRNWNLQWQKSTWGNAANVSSAFAAAVSAPVGK
jgi:arylsulfatase A-like enzyme